MTFQFNHPSLSAIRANLIIQKLVDFPSNVDRLNIFATGRTGSGKTTLGNRLIGIDYFMPSSGYQDCTDEINLIKFPMGLNYFDLPGVCSDDRLENYNRVALGLEQVEDFPFVENLILAKYSKDKTSEKQKFSISEFSLQQFKPDLIFYLIAPDKQFLSVDCTYLRDLLQQHCQVIYVFNMFASKETSSEHFASPQNISDAVNKLTKIHTSVLGKTSQPVIVQVNCWTGEGISELIARSGEMLGSEKGRLFEELIRYQSEKTPDKYVCQVKEEILRILAHAACQKPDGTSRSGETLLEDCQILWEFISSLLSKHQEMPSFVQQVIKAQVYTIISQYTEHQYEKVTRQMSKPIYKSVPVFKTVYEEVPDYNRPIQVPRFINKSTSNPFKKMKNIAKYGSTKKETVVYETVGYYNKTVSRQVHDGYREEYSHTEYWQEETGEQKLVGTTYQYFRQSAIVLLLALVHLLISISINDCESYKDVEVRYQSLYESYFLKVSKLPNFPIEPTEKLVFSILSAHLEKLFKDDFDEVVRTVACS
ncbi:MAG TPA: hypothetical protein DDW76_09685 [Cyanobacteria bacterium UBA11369]|nr:hypothetical protein [Cyanobacteria bacterium UBA11371]HBE34990.1 hypothetical protein [Cyanobacteria bacterium UBA11368]HBE49046.1 hypothetical protein [Cyanobacteria bacterium UBA11369]